MCNSGNAKVSVVFRKCKSYKKGKRKSYEKVCVIQKMEKLEN